MAERRKGRKRKENDVKLEEDKPRKIEYEVAKFLKGNLPQKKTTLIGHKVDYFISSKAIDCLLDSKWAKREKNQKEALFTSRESVVEFMEILLRHKFFHRAKKIIVSKDTTKKKRQEHDDTSAGEDAKEKKNKEKQSKKNKDGEKEKVKETEKEKEKEGEKEIDGEKEKKKEKKKVKLDMHPEQIFVDGNEPFVWIYDPVPLKAWFIGAGLVFGAVAICLFPLWPRTVRNYVYYLSIAAAGFLLFIIALTILRLVIFVLVWCSTFGKHHFWLLPNLTEDVGFFESFWPLYNYQYKGTETAKIDEQPLTEKDEENILEHVKKEESSENSENESQLLKESPQNGTNTDNGFEILDAQETSEQVALQ